ncbi:MAG TPA: DUF3861 family protein [Stenotrophomonas sp.]|jgi:hypothetical protein
MSRQRYRITVTPIETDGRPCSGRCTIEFEQRSADNWMRDLEALQRQRDLSGDACAAFTVATGLLKSLALRPGDEQQRMIAALQPQLDALLDRVATLAPARPSAH